MPLLRARENSTSYPLGRRFSRIFQRQSQHGIEMHTTASSPPPPGQDGISLHGLAKLRRTASRLMIKLRPHHGKTRPMSGMVDGTAEPHHRFAPLPPSALVPHGPHRIARIRSLFESSSGQQQAAPPKRKRSVRFEQYPDTSSHIEQLDGLSGERPSACGDDSEGSDASVLSHKAITRLAALTSKLNLDTGVNTVIRRTTSKKKHSIPHISTTFDGMNSGGHAIEYRHTSPSTHSSASPFNHDSKSAWSPASIASTAATSMTSLSRSSGSRKRRSPEECQTQSKSGLNGDDILLPPIEEDNGRFIAIPVQESPIDTTPSVMTVENAAAAKCALETIYDPVFKETPSPRSIRRKKFEKYLNELGMPHNDRIIAWQQWQRSESDHLRQTRCLKASAIHRHNVKGVNIAGFDVIRVLGKGSFGVVRLVTERLPASEDANATARKFSPTDGTAKRNLPSGKPLKDVFAMKVIRKSDMLRAAQEGHLRAERDFLVAAEGSR
ncbi:putative protein kinase [Septoria linicola]|nr:putative protein kinase [Septoria linicola]